MGTGSSVDASVSDSMYSGYSGHPKPPARNPSSRGPKSFEELDSSRTNVATQRNKSSNHSQANTSDATRSSYRNSLNEIADPSNKATTKSRSKSGPPVKSRIANNYGDEDIAFEQFYHKNGEVYTCMFQGGQRLIMKDWRSGDWDLFPEEYYNQGIIETTNVMQGGEEGGLDEDILMQMVYGGAGLSHLQKDEEKKVSVSQGTTDDRSGELIHPQMGIIPTYMFEEKRNVHCYFDVVSGEWVKMPLSWELHSEQIKTLIGQIVERERNWTDKYDILSYLRASNYDVDDCIKTWKVTGQSNSMKAVRSTLDDKILQAKEARIKELESHILYEQDANDRLMFQLSKTRREKEHMANNATQLKEQVASLEVTNKSHVLHNKNLCEELKHYKNVISKQKEKELEFERKERLYAEEQAKHLNSQLSQLSTANIYTKDEIEKLRLEAELANRKAEEYAKLAAESKQQAAAESQMLAMAAKKSETLVNKKLMNQVSNSANVVYKSYYKLKLEVEESFREFNDLLNTATQAAMQLPTEVVPPVNTVSMEEMEELRALYLRECLQRKLLYNQLQELRGNIRVYARFRKDEREANVISFPSDEDVAVNDVKGNKRLFRFDRVYNPESTQEEVFSETCPIVTSCVDGYNVCIIAYGQTGSGKTFTMMGPPANPGVNIRAIQELLRITRDRENIDYTLSVSMVEIYNEVVQDLLTNDCQVVSVKQVGSSVTIPGLTSHTVQTQGDVTDLMNLGMANRTVAATKMNSESSRSHLLVMLTVEGVDRTSGARSKGILTLVDLAGSERVSKTDASGQRLVEAAAINKSLTALGQVFAALGKSSLHVPYRNCKLTQVLQPSLSGDAKAALFVACSPAGSNLSETLSTLTFGSNAKQIELGPAKKNLSKGKAK